MKKPKALSLLLLGILLFSSLDHSYAIPHEYVGVNAGETFSWEVSVDQITFNKFNNDYSGRINRIKDQFPDIETIFSYGLYNQFDFTATILSVEGEYIGNTGWGNFYYMIVNISLSIKIPGIGYLPIPGGPLPIWVMSSDTGNYTINLLNLALGNALIYSPGDFFYVGLFAPLNLNWSKVVDDFQILLDLSENMTITLQNNGFKYTCPEGALNATSKEFNIIINYNNHGILEYADLVYDQSSLLTFRLTASKEAIFGFGITIILGIFLFDIIILIFFKVRRKKTIPHP